MRHNVRRTMRLESLESRQLLSANVAEVESNNSEGRANPFELDAADGIAELHGEIISRNDRDFFRFTAPVDGEVFVSSAAAEGSNLRPKLEITNGNRQQLFETQPNDGVFSGTFQVQAGETIFVRVRTQNRSVGEYVVQVSMPEAVVTPPGGGDNTGGTDTGGGDPPVDPPVSHVTREAEPNNSVSRANAAELSADGHGTLEGVSDNKRDKDYFVIQPTESGTVHVRVNAAGGDIAKLEVKNAQGIQLFDTDPNDGINSGSFQVEAGQRYLLRLRAPDKAPAPYLVDIALNDLLPDPPTGNTGGGDNTGGNTGGDDNGGNTGGDDNGGGVTQPVGELQLEGKLSGTSAASRASGKGSYEHRSDRVKLSVEVEDLSAGLVLQIHVNGSLVGTVTTNSFGTADLNLDSRSGHSVPVLAVGATIEVFGEDGTLLLSGTMKMK